MTEQELKISMDKWTKKNKICGSVFGRLKNTGKRIITREELEMIWYRDGAENMIRPSLVRNDKNKNYDLENCRFIDKKKDYTNDYNENFRYNEKEDYDNEWD